MGYRRTRDISLTLVLGLLIGVACADDIQATADVVADVLWAVDVRYDGAQSGLEATDLQAATDALVQRIEACEALHEEVAATRARVAELELAAAEPAPPRTADNTTFDSTTSSLEGDTVQAALEELEVRVQYTEEEILALDPTHRLEQIETLTQGLATQQAAIDALEEVPPICPDGMAAAADSCVEMNARPATSYEVATGECAVVGRRLCSYEELKLACDVFFATQESPEFTGDWVDVGVVLNAEHTFGDCIGNQTTSPTDGFTLRAYRCCTTQ